MKITRHILLISAIFALLSGCSSLKFPGVYKISIRQGNYIEQKTLDKLELGMTKRQVRYVMGTPLVQDTFSPDRWDYYYTRKRGNETQSKKRFTAYFEDNKLVRWDGDVSPGGGEKAEKEKEEKNEDAKNEQAANKP